MRFLRSLLALTLFASLTLPLFAEEPTLMIVLNRFKGRTVTVRDNPESKSYRPGKIIGIARDHVVIQDEKLIRYIAVSAIREIRLSDQEDPSPEIVLQP